MFPLMNAMTKLLTARYPVLIVWARFTDLVVMLRWRRWSAVCVGFAGAYQTGHRVAQAGGAAAPRLRARLCLYRIATRWVMAHDKPATGIIFAALLGSLGTALLVRFANSLADLAMLPALGGLGHFVVIKAFQVAPASVIAPSGCVELSGTATLGYLIFANFPDALTWVGALIIIASGHDIAMRERKRLGVR
jgi:drug/metabolite transporter (DMT)-like permease